MDDLLIVRISDRSKDRFSRKRRMRNAPLGMHFGLLAGVGFGLAFATASKIDPTIGVAVGTAFGLVLGALMGRFLKPNRHRRDKRRRPRYSYDGMPFGTEALDESEAPVPENER